jgi:hypothetical protein
MLYTPTSLQAYTYSIFLYEYCCEASLILYLMLSFCSTDRCQGCNVFCKDGDNSIPILLALLSINYDYLGKLYSNRGVSLAVSSVRNNQAHANTKSVDFLISSTIQRRVQSWPLGESRSLGGH